jgi:hypothetical protein
MQPIACPKCHRSNGSAAHHCLYCGYRLKPDLVIERDKSVTIIKHEQMPAKRMVCDSCSAPLAENRRDQSIRCDYCGAEYNNESGRPVIIINHTYPFLGSIEPGSGGSNKVEIVESSFKNGVETSHIKRTFRVSIGETGCLLALLIIPVDAIARTLYRRASARSSEMRQVRGARGGGGI